MVRHCHWKIWATPGAFIKPDCLAQRPLCHKVNLLSCVASRPPLCHQENLQSCVVQWMLRHKVNLLRCEARRRHFMTGDLFGIGQTNILALLFIRKHLKTSPEINTLHQITGKVIDVSRTYIPLKALMIPLKCVKLRGVV